VRRTLEHAARRSPAPWLLVTYPSEESICSLVLGVRAVRAVCDEEQQCQGQHRWGLGRPRMGGDYGHRSAAAAAAATRLRGRASASEQSMFYTVPRTIYVTSSWAL
jgi:hypothetical protein